MSRSVQRTADTGAGDDGRILRLRLRKDDGGQDATPTETHPIDASPTRQSPRKADPVQLFVPAPRALSGISKPNTGKERGQGRFWSNIVASGLARPVVLYLSGGNLQTCRLAKPSTQETNSHPAQRTARTRLAEDLVAADGVTVESLVPRTF